MPTLEIHLTKQFLDTVKEQESLNVSELACEFNYIRGRTDVIAINKNGDLLAFEAKLLQWKTALHQAYKNSSFAHYSYVIVPTDVAKNALRGKYEFEKRGVGLCSVDSSGVHIEIHATKKRPLQPWLTNNALEYIAR